MTFDLQDDRSTVLPTQVAYWGCGGGDKALAAQVEPAKDMAGVHQGVSRRSQGGKTDKKNVTAKGEEEATGNRGLTTDTQKLWP
jgi:hypothetical protein